jgi:hypothetical protein
MFLKCGGAGYFHCNGPDFEIHRVSTPKRVVVLATHTVFFVSSDESKGPHLAD